MISYLRSDGSRFESHRKGYSYFICENGNYTDFTDDRAFMAACAKLDKAQKPYRIGNISTMADFN